MSRWTTGAVCLLVILLAADAVPRNRRSLHDEVTEPSHEEHQLRKRNEGAETEQEAAEVEPAEEEEATDEEPIEDEEDYPACGQEEDENVIKERRRRRHSEGGAHAEHDHKPEHTTGHEGEEAEVNKRSSDDSTDQDAHPSQAVDAAVGDRRRRVKRVSRAGSSHRPRQLINKNKGNSRAGEGSAVPYDTN